jgi:hypothetical protein
VEITSHQRRSKIEIKQNESLKLECSVRMAKPAATIVWYRGNVQIKGGDIHVTTVPIADGQCAFHKSIFHPAFSRKHFKLISLRYSRGLAHHQPSSFLRVFFPPYTSFYGATIFNLYYLFPKRKLFGR